MAVPSATIGAGWERESMKGITAVKGGVTAASGFAAGSVHAGIKAGRSRTVKPDLGLVLSAGPCTAAGAFTTNAVRAACVDWNRALLPSSGLRAVVCNSGNANACTGAQGMRDVAETAKLAATLCGLKESQVLVSSTGVIGRPMPMQKVRAALPLLGTRLRHTRAGGEAFAYAIMTTDTVRKRSARSVKRGGGRYVVGGCAKGSGMIHPSMATMLAFVTTDAAIAPATLHRVLRRVVDRTFNNLTVDGDTSTNDMILVLANGVSGVRVTSAALGQFEEALFQVCNDLCAAIAADGEGATKRVEIHVKGGRTFEDARKAARAIANSNLVKTAIFGNDPNWGRILCAIGYSGALFSEKKIKVSIGSLPVCHALRPVAFPAARMQRTLRSKVVPIHVNLGLGSHTAIAHTCDLTYEYVRINAEYTT